MKLFRTYIKTANLVGVALGHASNRGLDEAHVYAGLDQHVEEDRIVLPQARLPGQANLQRGQGFHEGVLGLRMLLYRVTRLLSK